MFNTKNSAISFAILSAALYAVNIPLSKILLTYVEPTVMAALLYLGAGVGLLLYSLLGKALGKQMIAKPLTKKELPYTIAMVVLDIAAPILLMLGISRTTSANVSLLNNFEIVATSLIAFFVFKEMLSKRLKIAILLVTIASVVLGMEGTDGFVFNMGSVFVLAAATCWGMENNCTKMISGKSAIQITTIKGCFSGLGSLLIALFIGEAVPPIRFVLVVLLLGFLSYGLSISLYIRAQKDLGAAKTSAYYSISPFLGVIFSVMFLRERPALQFYVALFIMAVSTVLMVKDTITLNHTHTHIHLQTHSHGGGLVHSHEVEHTHIHVHGKDGEVHSHSHPDIADHKHNEKES